MAEDRKRALERRRADLLERRAALRAAGAPPGEIIPVVEELDQVESELRATPAPPQAPVEEERLRWKDALLVSLAAVVVGAVATGAAAFGFRSSSAAATTATETVVRVRLHSSIHGTSCSATSARARLTWTWTLERSGHDGEVALVRARGPGLAPTYRVPVSDGHVRLTRTSPCEPAGTVWTVRLVRVGSKPVQLAH